MPSNSRYCSLDEFYAAVPLDPAKSTIRVIDVDGLTNTASVNEPLFATVRVIELDAEPTPKFATISYVWGSEVTTESPSILLQYGHSLCDFRLTQNCYEALINLRAKLGSFTIWVDAICINQTEAKEKTHQVNQMGEIYAASEVTYIWLGPATPAIKRAIVTLTANGLARYFFDDSEAEFSSRIKLRQWAALAELSKLSILAYVSILTYPVKIFEAGFQAAWPVKSDLRKRLGIDFSIAAQVVPYDTVLESEWLQRMWTYQELVLAHQPIVVWGENHVDWSRLLAAVLYSRHIRQSSWHRWVDMQTPWLDAWEQLGGDRDYLRQRNNVLADRTKVELCNTDQKLYETFLKETTTYWVLLIFGLELFLLVLLIITVSVTRTSVKRSSYGDWSIPIITLVTAFFGLYVLFALLWASTKFMPTAARTTHLQLLSVLGSRTCKLPQDYNFAMRSIIQLSSNHVTRSLGYTASLAEVNLDLCIKLIENGADTDLLRAAIFYPYRNGCPSWVVDWARLDTQYSRRSLWSSIFSDARSSRSRIWPAYAIRETELPASDRDGEQAIFRQDSDRLAVLNVLSFDLGEVVSVVPYFLSSNNTEQDTASHIHNLRLLVWLLARCPPRYVPRCLMYGGDRYFLGLKKAFKLIADNMNDSSPEEVLQKLKTVRYYDPKADLSLFGHLHRALEAFIAEDIQIVIVQPPCDCGHCGVHLGISKGCAEDQGGLLPAVGDKIIAVSQLNGFVIVRAKSLEVDSNEQNHELVSCCEIFGYNGRRDLYRPGEYVYGFRVCPNLKTPVPAYTRIC